MATRTTKQRATGKTLRVHLLDVGPQEYGDALLCEFGDETILIDGAHTANHRDYDEHPAIQEQLAKLLNVTTPVRVSLLIVTHGHEDHIGCLPYLVQHDLVRAEYALVADPDLSWGEKPTDSDSDQLDSRVKVVLAGLREEPRSVANDDSSIKAFLADAAGLEQRYRDMIATLKEHGTRVIRKGKDDERPLLQRFRNIGLRILGPSANQLAECTALQQKKLVDWATQVTDRLRRDDQQTAESLYRNIRTSGTDATDAGRIGALVNLQSIVAFFAVGDKKFLFGGDMQFADPQVNNEIITQGVEQLLRDIKSNGPYSFAKLSHHGSNNAFDEDILADLGATSRLGICAGSESTAHPNPQTLQILAKHTRDVQWARTDHNGLSTLAVTPSAAQFTITRGKLNDPVPNTPDTSLQVLPALPQPAPTTFISTTQETSAPAVTSALQNQAHVEITARIPHQRTKVTISVTIEPDETRVEASTSEDRSAILPSLRLQQRLDNLVILTNADRLAANIGAAEATAVVNALRQQGCTVIDDVPANAPAAQAAAYGLAKTIAAPNVKGVVLLGGYDVVPSESVDALPPSLRARVRDNDDPDNFVVWCDDVYGRRRNGPPLPVSRIPDGHTAGVVFGALSGVPSPGGSIGVRNRERPFAEEIYAMLPGRRPLLASAPSMFNNPTFLLDAPYVYLMLHGDYTDGSRFWGEGTPSGVEAVNLTNIPRTGAGVVFTGCCWGALTVDKPAGRLMPGQPVGTKSPGASLALTFLQRGAKAFIGCTGAHYSPSDPPYNYFGGPLHQAFWTAILHGQSPAAALLTSKTTFLAGIPARHDRPVSQAIELKLWRQYTCLGLGW